MLNYWEKFDFIDIYAEHKVDTPIFEEGILLLIDGVEVEVEDATEDANVEVEGASEDASVGVEGANVEVEGAGAEVEGATEGASVGVEGATKGASVEVEGAGAGVEGATEGVNVEVEGACAGVEGVTKGANVDVEGVGVGVEGAPEGAGVGVEGASEVECDNESENAYSINIEFLSDGEGDEELQAARVRRNCKQHREGTKVESDNENSREENDIEAEIHIETDNEGGDAEIEENTNENDSDDYNIDANESSLVSSDEEKDEATLRRRKKNPKYNRNLESPQFCLGMLFTDGKEFKDAIYKYLRCSRRELKIVKNEPRRISVKCIASAKCPWRIFASTNRQTRCRRAKSLVTSRLAGSCKEEFALLWDYADELRTKNPGSTIKMAVNRVSDISSPHFKRFYGLEVAINDILPRVEHRNCAQHVYANWSGRKREKHFSFVFWQIVKSTTEREWEDNKQVLSKLDEKLAAELFGKQEKKWTEAFQGLHATLDIVDNNMYDYLHSCYLKDIYIKAYSYALQPINGSHDWKKSGIEAVLPHIKREMPGRPKKNRMKAKDETKKLKSGHISRTGLIMTCRNCGGEGHNKRSCPNLKQTANQGTNKGLHTTLDFIEHNFLIIFM
ncbi:hypothetical protein V6N11_057991 [Hibiscus sabdariffa]|uniref:CCHC-type domain-containing protein n=1 Tax=Hibiscus sabdariffa TaxID=183260 RepID=A0ABR2P4C2_9ROSI